MYIGRGHGGRGNICLKRNRKETKVEIKQKKEKRYTTIIVKSLKYMQSR
jgi:hypothetical protein